MRVEKSYRGITERLARHYLTNLGGEVERGERAGEVERGERAGEDADDGENDVADGEDGPDVVGDGWRASLSSEKVRIGPSMRLTEVTVVFEGDEDALEDLVADFSRKALRAGG